MLRRFWLILGVLALVTISAPAQEKLTLTTPVTQASVTDFTIQYFAATRSPATFTVQLRPNNTALVDVICTYQGTKVTCSNGYAATAPSGYADTQAFLVAFNKTNFASPNPSINKFICTQLIADGVASGSCTGTPQ
jgi:hypothetical protein